MGSVIDSCNKKARTSDGERAGGYRPQMRARQAMAAVKLVLQGAGRGGAKRSNPLVIPSTLRLALC